MTKQLRRSLRFVWSSSEGHLYREQKRLVELGWATVEQEPSGARVRNRYTITNEGAEALREWLSTEPEAPHFEIEGMLRLFNADHGTTGDLVGAMAATASAAREMLDELVGYVDEYLEDGGPLWMLEHGLGGSEARIEWHGREMIPERLHVIALVISGTAELLGAISSFTGDTAAEVSGWNSPTDPAATRATRKRLEAVRDRFRPDGT